VAVVGIVVLAAACLEVLRSRPRASKNSRARPPRPRVSRMSFTSQDGVHRMPHPSGTRAREAWPGARR